MRKDPIKPVNSMRRAGLLFVLLAVTAAMWAGLKYRDYRWRVWLASAPKGEIQQYLKDHPDQPAALIRLGILMRNSGDKAEAEKILRHAVESAPDNETTWIELSRTLADDKEAIHGLDTYLKSFPDRAAVMAELARRYTQMGDISAAQPVSRRATELAPDSPDAWRAFADVLMAAGNRSEAEKDYRKALSLHDDPDTRLSLARLLIPLQRYSEIIAICAPILQAPNSQEISVELHARALVYTAGARLYNPLTPSELAQVQAQLQEADGLSAKLPPGERFLPPYFLGESFLRISKPGDAIPFLQRSVQEGPMFAGSLYSLARAYRLVGDIARANATMERHERLSRSLSEQEMKQGQATRP